MREPPAVVESLEFYVDPWTRNLDRRSLRMRDIATHRSSNYRRDQ